MVKKRKARLTFDKNPFKITKKLFGEGKNGVVNIPKETLEPHPERKYSDSLADTPMGNFGELNRPQPPEEKFDYSPIKLGEVKDFVRKARAKNTAGINGISYKLYKSCPNVLASLWKLLQVAHIKKINRRGLGIRRIIYIPKEKNSKHLEQFRPISLLNVEVKIFFRSHC